MNAAIKFRKIRLHNSFMHVFLEIVCVCVCVYIYIYIYIYIYNYKAYSPHSPAKSMSCARSQYSPGGQGISRRIRNTMAYYCQYYEKLGEVCYLRQKCSLEARGTI